MAKRKTTRSSSPQPRSRLTRVERHRVLKRSQDDSNRRRLPYVSSSRRHDYRSSPDPYRRKPVRNQERSARGAWNSARGQRRGGRNFRSGQQQWQPTRGHRPFVRGKGSFRGKRPFTGQQQYGRGQRYHPRGRHQVRRYQQQRWKHRERTPSAAHSDTTDKDSSKPKSRGEPRASRSSSQLDRVSRSSSRLDQVSESGSQLDPVLPSGLQLDQVSESGSELDQVLERVSELNQVVSELDQVQDTSPPAPPTNLPDKVGTTKTLEQLINQAVESISDLDTPPGSVGSVDLEDASELLADDPNLVPGVKEEEDTTMRFTRSGKPSRWDVPPSPSPRSEEEGDGAHWQETEKIHTQLRETAELLWKATEKPHTQWKETDMLHMPWKETDKAPTQWEETAKLSSEWEEIDKVSAQWEETDKASTQANKTPTQETEGPLQTRLLGLSGSLEKDDPLQIVQEITQLAEELRTLTSALPALSEDTSAALPPIPTPQPPEVTASSSAATSAIPQLVPRTVKMKRKNKKQRSEKVFHESLATTQSQTVDFAGADPSPQYFAGSGLAENAWQPHLDKMFEEIAVKTSPRKIRLKKAPEKPERYEPREHLTSGEPKPVKSVSEKRIIRVKTKPAASEKVADKREVKRKSKSYFSEYESRRLVKIKSPTKSSKVTSDKDSWDHEMVASWGSEKTRNESSQPSPPKQNPSSHTYPEDLSEKACRSRETEENLQEDALVDSLAHASIQPGRDFDFSQFFPHSRSEEQYFIDSLAQKCSQIQLDRGNTLNPQLASGHVDTAQHVEYPLADPAYELGNEHEVYPLRHSAIQTVIETEEHPLADKECPIADPSFQASNVQYEEYLLQDATFQPDVGHHQAENASGMDDVEKGTTAKPCSTAYEDAALSGQGAYLTDQVIGNPRSFAASKDFAPCQHGDVAVSNRGTRKIEPVVSNEGNLPANLKDFIPGEHDDRTRVESRATGVLKSSPSLPSSLTPRLEGTAVSRQARTANPAVRKARKGSISNMNERDKLKALFSVRKKKPALTRTDSSGPSETQPSKPPNKPPRVGLMPTETSSNAEDCSFTQKSLQASPSSAEQNVQAGKDVRMSCNPAVSNSKQTVTAQNDGEKLFCQPVPNMKQTLTEGMGIHTFPGNALQSHSSPVQNMGYDSLDDMDQSGDNGKYIDDDDILREIDSCLETSTPEADRDKKERLEGQKEAGSEEFKTASNTLKTKTPTVSNVSTTNVAADVLKSNKDRFAGSDNLAVNSSEPSSFPDSSQSCIIVEQDPSGNTEINISVAISADDMKNSDVRAGGDTSSHKEISDRLTLPATGQLRDSGMDTDEDSEYQTTFFNLRLPRKQALEIHVKPMLQVVDELGNSIEVEVSTDAAGVAGNASISAAETQLPKPRSITCSASTKPGSVTQSASKSLREKCLAESRSITFSKSTISVSMEKSKDSEECSETDEVHQNDEVRIGNPALDPFSRIQTFSSDADTTPDSPEAHTPQDILMDTEEKSEEPNHGEVNRTAKNLSADDDRNNNAIEDWLAQREEELQDKEHEKAECPTRYEDQRDGNLAQSPKKLMVGFSTGESGNQETQMQAEVEVPAVKMNQEQSTAQEQQRLREEEFIHVQADLHKGREQGDAGGVETFMETRVTESSDVRANSSHGGEEASGATDLESHMEMEAPILCGSATGKPDIGSPTSPPCLLQWDECEHGAAGVCASPPHLEPQASCTSPSPSPSTTPTTPILFPPALLEPSGKSVSLHKQGSFDCASCRSRSASVFPVACVCNCNPSKQTVLVTEPSSLPNVSLHHALYHDSPFSALGDKCDARAQCVERMDDGSGGGGDVGDVSVMSKHTERPQKSCSLLDLSSVPGTMSVTTTNTTPADTLDLRSSLSLDLDENTSPVSDDSDDSLSDGPEFVSSVARSPLPLSAVNTNVLAQGERTLQVGKQTTTSSADERPTLFSLDSLLTDTKNAEAEEQEILVMQSELKRELMSNKGIGIASEGEDDTEEADDEGFTDEQKDTLLKLRLEEGQIQDVHPGEAVLADHACGQLFTHDLKPADCGVTNASHNPLGQLLSNFQPEMLMDILSSDIISLAYNALPCKEQVQRWLLFLLSCHSNATVVQKCGDQLLQVLQWQMEDVLDGNERHTWAPSILDMLHVFVNWGASRESLVFEAEGAGSSQLGEVMPLHENRGQMELPADTQKNVEPVLKLLSCLLQARPSYSTEELNQLLVMVCKVSLDQSLVRECLLSELQVCMASILDCYEASQWYTAVPWLCGALGSLSDHHHNQLYVTQLFSPTCLRGGYLQQRLAYFFLHNAINHCNPTDQQLRDFQMQDLCELIAGLRPLLQSDNYQLSSLIHLLDLSVGPAVQHITQRKQLCRLLESVRLIVSEIRDSVQQLDCTKVKGMLLHLCLKWDLSVKASNTKQRKIFSCLVSRPVPVEKLEDQGQLCNEEEGTDDLAFPTSDDEGEVDGGGGKRLKTEGDWIERESEKTLKDTGDSGERETATQGPSSKGDAS